ncbi:MAG TPA: SulP family inorganic anion transporter, partial [Tepidiformaceae bacterium]|nr:SulP family inorganic anion transporter [Tepidiformaceae bacterium]
MRALNSAATAPRGRHIPEFPPLPSLASLRRNAISGLVVGVIAIPLSIALAVAVGVPPVAGLYTAVFAGATASVFGGSRYNITGPTAALVPILSSAVLRHGAVALPMVGLLAGIALILMSLFRFGRLIRFMPGFVIVGFTAGIALSIAFGQLNALLAVSGTDPSLEHFHERLWDTLRHLNTIHPATPLVAGGSLATLLVSSRLFPRVPPPLVAVVLVTAVTWAFAVDTPTIASRYGELPRDIPTPSFAFFDLSLIPSLLPVAFAVAVLGAVESLLSAVVADGMAPTSERHDPDRELRGQGLANLVSPVMGGIPATAAIARTAAGIRSGGDSRLTGVFHAVT